jgi:hypothetical protein
VANGPQDRRRDRQASIREYPASDQGGQEVRVVDAVDPVDQKDQLSLAVDRIGNRPRTGQGTSDKL